MKAKLNAIKSLQKFLAQSEANRLKPKPVPEAPKPAGEQLSDESLEALGRLASESPEG